MNRCKYINMGFGCQTLARFKQMFWLHTESISDNIPHFDICRKPGWKAMFRSFSRKSAKGAEINDKIRVKSGIICFKINLENGP